MPRRSLGACSDGVAPVTSALAGSAPVSETPPATPASAAAIPATIGLAEYRLDVPGLRFLYRTRTFTALNIGRAPHALAISGPDHPHRSARCSHPVSPPTSPCGCATAGANSHVRWATAPSRAWEPPITAG